MIAANPAGAGGEPATRSGVQPYIYSETLNKPA